MGVAVIAHSLSLSLCVMEGEREKQNEKDKESKNREGESVLDITVTLILSLSLSFCLSPYRETENAFHVMYSIIVVHACGIYCYLCTASSCMCIHYCCQQGQMPSSPTSLVFLGDIG